MHKCRCGIVQPIIRIEELDTITRLLFVFAEVHFNADGNPIARLSTKLPVFGTVIVSYYDRENHCKVFPVNGGDDLLNFYPDDFQNKDQLISQITAKLKQKVADTLQ